MRFQPVPISGSPDSSAVSNFGAWEKEVPPSRGRLIFSEPLEIHTIIDYTTGRRPAEFAGRPAYVGLQPARHIFRRTNFRWTTVGNKDVMKMVEFIVGSVVALMVVGWALQLRDAMAGKLAGALTTNGRLSLNNAAEARTGQAGFHGSIGFTRRNTDDNTNWGNTCHLNMR